MDTRTRIINVSDRLIYISWSLLFFGVINLPLPMLNSSAIAVRLNVIFATFVFLYKLTKKNINKTQLRVMILAYLLLTVQVIGLLGKISAYSITSLVLLMLVIIYIIFSVDINYNNINHKIFKLPYYGILLLSSIDIFFIGGEYFDRFTIGDNTMGGMLVFLSIINIALSEYHERNRNKKWLRLDILSLIPLISILMFTRSRTSIATLFLILFIYLIFTKLKFNRKQARLLFWIFVGTVLCLSIVYSFITTFSFYSDWNLISIKYFGKNIDSSRPMLWRASIEAIGNKWLFGLGTGTLPSDFVMFEASFHNQFLQLFMQNGLMGLVIFCFLLYTLWKPMADNLRDPVIKVCAAAFFGIIIYNSFETTLLQNKIALGLIQWQLIAIGVSRGQSYKMKNLDRTKKLSGR